MGLSFRKRVGGLNISASKRNGIGFSYSVRVAKGVTFNLKPGRAMRTTLSIPGTGVRWTSSTAKPKEPKAYKAKKLTRREERNLEEYYDARQQRLDDITDERDEFKLEIVELRARCNQLIDDFDMMRADPTMAHFIPGVIEDIGELQLEETLMWREYWGFNDTFYEEALSQGLKDNRVPKDKFNRLRGVIIKSDEFIDSARRCGWNEDQLIPMLNRRRDAVLEMKMCVEDNVVHE